MCCVLIRKWTVLIKYNYDIHENTTKHIMSTINLDAMIWNSASLKSKSEKAEQRYDALQANFLTILHENESALNGYKYMQSPIFYLAAWCRMFIGLNIFQTFYCGIVEETMLKLHLWWLFKLFWTRKNRASFFAIQFLGKEKQ